MYIWLIIFIINKSFCHISSKKVMLQLKILWRLFRLFILTLFWFTAGSAEFVDLSILDPATNYSITATCGDYEITGPEFAVHDWPEMATVRKQTIGLKYTGSLYYAVETINALNGVIVEGQDSITVTDIETGLPPQVCTTEKLTFAHFCPLNPTLFCFHSTSTLTCPNMIHWRTQHVMMA